MTTTVAELLIQARETLGMTAQELADAAEVSRRTIRGVEEEGRFLGRDTAKAVSAALGGLLSPSVLAGFGPKGDEDIRRRQAMAAAKLSRAEELAAQADAFNGKARVLRREALSDLHVVSPDAA